VRPVLFVPARRVGWRASARRDMRLHHLVAISSALHGQLSPPRALVLRMDATPPPPPPEAPPSSPDRRGLAVAGLVAGGAGVTAAAALGLASALGWDLSAVGDSSNRGVGTPLSREESAALLKAELRSAALRESPAAEGQGQGQGQAQAQAQGPEPGPEQGQGGCVVVEGQPLSRECRELQVTSRVRVRVRVRARVGLRVRVRVRFGERLTLTLTLTFTPTTLTNPDPNLAWQEEERALWGVVTGTQLRAK
jgi:hypothetical protein